MSQSARTPPPWPPRAAIVSLIGRSAIVFRLALERVAQSLPAPLQGCDHSRPHGVCESIPPRWVVNQLCTVERRAEHRSVRHFAADPAPDTTVVDMGHRVRAQRIGIVLHRQRRTARETNTRVVPSTRIRIDPETLAHDALTVLDRLA